MSVRTVLIWAGLLASGGPLQVATAQQESIRGVVVDAAGVPMVGATVLVVGTPIRVFTDDEGRFAVRVRPGAEVTLRVMRLGYRAMSVSAQGGDTDLRLVMAAAAFTLDEIIVTGTSGLTEKRAIGNTVTTIAATEAVERAPIRDMTSLLNGRAPGVTIIPSTGQVGSGPNVRIRGVSTFSLYDHPLVYIDGIRVDNADDRGIRVQIGKGILTGLNDINPEEIESVEVIKGPAAATLYGTEASHGVIQIITKKGTAARPEWQVYGHVGATWFRNAQRRIDKNWGIDVNTGQPFLQDLFAQEKALGNGIFQTGLNQSYGASVRGGGDVFRYYLGMDIDDEEGAEPTNDMQRLGARTNFSVVPNETVDLNVSVGYSRIKRNLSSQGLLFATVFGWPLFFQGEPGDSACGLVGCFRGFWGGPPEFHTTWQRFPHSTNKLAISLQGHWTPTSWLTHRLTIGQDVVDEKSEHIIERLTPDLAQYVGTDPVALGAKTLMTRDAINTTVDYSGSARARLSHAIQLTSSVGVQYYRKLTEFVRVSGEEFPVPGIDVTEAAATIRDAGDEFIENNTLGMYAEGRIGIDDRIFVTGAIRVDDNSAFGEDFDVVAYPKFSATWVVREGSGGLLDALKVRGAYGQSGQQPASFSALRTYEPVTGGDGTAALTPQSVGNSGLKPERGSEFDIGFDAGLFDSRVGVEFTYYNSRTRDAILERNVSPTLGFPGTQFVNAGEIANQGIELQINALALHTDDVDVDLMLNLSTNANKVVDLGGVDGGLGFIITPFSGSSGLGTQRFVPGFPVASFFWPKVVDATVDPATGLASNLTCDGGDPGGKKLPDGTPLELGGPPVPCDEAPFLFLGTSHPQFEGSFGATATLFQRFRLYGLIDWRTGWRKFDNNLRPRCQILLVCEENFFPERFSGSAEGRARLAEMQSGGTFQSFVMNDATFAKLREVSLTVELPSRWVGAIGAKRASITVAGRNLATWTSYTGLDPEGQLRLDLGFINVEEATVPQLAQFLTSVNLAF